MTKTFARTLYDMVVLSDGVAMFQGIGEQMAKESNVSCAKDLLFSVTVSVEVSLGINLAQVQEECWNARRFDTVFLLHMCFLCHRVVLCT